MLPDGQRRETPCWRRSRLPSSVTGILAGSRSACRWARTWSTPYPPVLPSNGLNSSSTSVTRCGGRHPRDCRAANFAKQIAPPGEVVAELKI